MDIIQNPAPEIKAIVKELSAAIIKGSTATHVHTALVFAVNAFCTASDTPHEDFCSNLIALRDKVKNPCA